MYNLWTDQQIEGWLERETKTLTMLDGSPRRVAATKLVWEFYEEEVLKIGKYTPEEVIGLVLSEAEECKRTFDEAFSIIVVYVAGVVRNRDWGDGDEPLELA